MRRRFLLCASPGLFLALTLSGCGSSSGGPTTGKGGDNVNPEQKQADDELQKRLEAARAKTRRKR